MVCLVWRRLWFIWSAYQVRLVFVPCCVSCGGRLWRIWLRHCATTWEVAGSISGGVLGIFRWHNPSGPTIALGSTQPLTEMSIGNTLGGKGGLCVGLTTLPTFICRLSWNVVASTFWNPKGLSKPVQWLFYIFIFIVLNIESLILIGMKNFRIEVVGKNDKHFMTCLFIFS